MKALRLLLTLGLILVANAAIADTPTASDAYANGYSAENGTAIITAKGSNGTYQYVYATGNAGTIDEIEDVEDVYSVQVVTVSSTSSSFAGGCSLVIPEGMTGSASYTISRQPAGYSGTYSAYISIGDSLYKSGTGSGTVTLEPGSYDLKCYTSGGSNLIGIIMTNLVITIDED